MRCEPTRRSFMAGIGAAAATGAAGLPIALARDEPSALAYRTAGELVEALAGKEVSSRELVDAAISRIERLDPKINAVVVRDFERAREAAAAADAALAKGERRPLLGLPMTVKEQFNVVGMPTSWGDPQFWRWYPATDTLAVQRLKNAGAVILGKTNVPLHLTDWQSYNEVYGTTNNPWDLSAAVPAGRRAAPQRRSPPASYRWNSVRISAARCARRRISAASSRTSRASTSFRSAARASPEPRRSRFATTFAVIGPMARSAADLALELAVIAGPDEWSEGIGYKLALPPPRHDQLADFRVLVIDRHPLCPTEAAVSAALDGLAERLAKAGCQVVREQPQFARSRADQLGSIASCCPRFSAPICRPRWASRSRPPPVPCRSVTTASPPPVCAA